MEYNSKSIYEVYFPDNRQIETICDFEFDEFDTILITKKREAEELFSFPDLEQTLGIIYDLPIRKVVLTPALLPASVIPTSLIKDDNHGSLSSTLSNDNITPQV